MRNIPPKPKRAEGDPAAIWTTLILWWVFFGGGMVLVLCGVLGSLEVMGWLVVEGSMEISPLFVLLLGLSLVLSALWFSPRLYVQLAERARRAGRSSLRSVLRISPWLDSLGTEGRRSKEVSDEWLDEPSWPGPPEKAPIRCTTSPIRLARERLGTRSLVYLALITTTFNAAASSLVVWVAQGGPVGESVWMAQDQPPGEPSMVPAIVFCVVGLVLLVVLILAVVHAFPSVIGMTPPLVEISAHPLRPDDDIEVFVSQVGPRRLKVLQVQLACRERITSRDGEETEYQSRALYQDELLRQEGLVIRRGTPYEARLPVRIPGGAIPSFKAEGQEIAWYLSVTSEYPRGFGFEFRFPIVVLP